MTTPYTLPEPYYKHGSGDIQSYGAAQVRNAFAAGAASRDADWEDAINQRDAAEARAQYLQTEVEALRADAGRYRWLRHEAGDIGDLYIGVDSASYPNRWALTSEEADAAISAAIAAEATK